MSQSLGSADGRWHELLGEAPASAREPSPIPVGQERLQEWYRYDPKEARELWTAASFDIPLDELRVLLPFNPDDAGENRDIYDFLARSLADALDIRVEEAVDSPSSFWEAATDRSQEAGWELLLVASDGGEARNRLGVPHESHLRHYDPRGVGGTIINHYAGSPRDEIDMDARALIEMLDAQEQELHFTSRIELLAEVQKWILDRAWGFLDLPARPSSHFAFNSRLRDHAPEEWMTSYRLRRESMWLGDYI